MFNEGEAKWTWDWGLLVPIPNLPFVIVILPLVISSAALGLVVPIPKFPRL